MSANGPDLLKIGDLSRKLNIHRETIRYYERCGFISPQSRTESGYKLYNTQTLKVLSFIIKARALDFTLNEIRELRNLLYDDLISCDDVENILLKKVDDIDRKMNELRKIKLKLLKYCYGCDNRYDSCKCPIKNELEESHI